MFVGATKNAAEAQFAAARAKIAQKIKGKPAAEAPAAAADCPAPASSLQTVSAPPSGAFAPAQSQQQRATPRCQPRPTPAIRRR